MHKHLPNTCKSLILNLNFVLLLAHVAVKSTTPGPGTYNNSLKNHNGNPVLSDHRNRGTPLLHLPIKKLESGRDLMKSGSKDIPGPGKYSPTSNVLAW